MPADYEEVLKDIDAQIAAHQAKIHTLQAARPTILMLQKEIAPKLPPGYNPGPYANMGPTDAIPVVLKGQALPLTTAQIAERLQAGGVRSNAQNFVASVSATLSQLKDKGIVRKVGDSWKLEEESAESGISITDDDIPF